MHILLFDLNISRFHLRWFLCVVAFCCFRRALVQSLISFSLAELLGRNSRLLFHASVSAILARSSSLYLVLFINKQHGQHANLRYRSRAGERKPKDGQLDILNSSCLSEKEETEAMRSDDEEIFVSENDKNGTKKHPRVSPRGANSPCRAMGR